MHINWWKLFLRWRTEGKCSILLCIFLHYLYLAAILVYIGILYWEWFENKWSFEKYIIYNIPSVHLQGAPVWKAVFPHMMSLYFPSKISACEWIIRLPVLPKIESWSSSFNRLFFPSALVHMAPVLCDKMYHCWALGFPLSGQWLWCLIKNNFPCGFLPVIYIPLILAEWFRSKTTFAA